jgi:O-antigen/teichoic acid export membrane protein
MSSIKSLGKQSLIYGLGHVAARLVNFLLIPLYTNTIPAHDYGIVSLVFVLISFANVFFIHGMDSAMLRFYGMEENDSKKQAVFSTSWLWIAGISIVFSFIIYFFVPSISKFSIGIENKQLILLAVGILFFDALSTLPKILLRMQNKATMFVSIEFINVGIILALNVWWIGIQKLGIEYIFISNLIASAVITIILLIYNLKHQTWSFNKQLKSEMLLFAIPYLPAGLANMVNELIDRYILKWMLDETAVGIYSAGYKLGISMLIVTMAFKFAWQPFFLGKAKEEDSYKTFMKVGTWFITIALFVVLTTTLFIKEFIQFEVFGKSFLGSEYWHSVSIVPVVQMAYVFLGIFTIQLAGIYIHKKTKWIPIITGFAALVNIISNIILIQHFGWKGAAWATLVGYMFMAVLQYFIVKRFYPLFWEWKKIAIIFTCFCIAILIWYFILLHNMFFGKLVLVGLFGFISYNYVLKEKEA